MTITDDMLRAIDICHNGGWQCAEHCPFYGVEDCPVNDISAEQLARDLLKERELNTELSTFMYRLLEGSDDYTLSKVAVMGELQKIMDKYK